MNALGGNEHGLGSLQIPMRQARPCLAESVARQSIREARAPLCLAAHSCVRFHRLEKLNECVGNACSAVRLRILKLVPNESLSVKID